ncbi:MAG TPA: hypothetical protein VJM32_03205 [Candidatus Saccharimonadales bacterium]|nr:hypothetical protein [Candidatus Saccharimonadales bacterium]
MEQDRGLHIYADLAEAPDIDLASLTWTNTTSPESGGEAILVADLPDGGAVVRKQADSGGIVFTAAGWACFTASASRGDYDVG